MLLTAIALDRIASAASTARCSYECLDVAWSVYVSACWSHQTGPQQTRMIEPITMPFMVKGRSRAVMRNHVHDGFLSLLLIFSLSYLLIYLFLWESAPSVSRQDVVRGE